MSGFYLNADQVADAKNALGCGVSVEQLAQQLATSEDELRRVLGLPRWQRPPGRLVPDWDQSTRDAVSKR